ncbi:MAG TPA: hypothetical protein VGF99_10740, partial [Myxococcota bacterium]
MHVARSSVAGSLCPFVAISLVVVGVAVTAGCGAAAGLDDDLPTGDTAVRVALFGDADEPSSADVRVWPAWRVVAADDAVAFVLSGDGVVPSERLRDDVAWPAADLDFGAPVDDGIPTALVLAADIDAATVGTIGDIDGAAAFGISTYLAYSSSTGITIDSTDADGSPSQVAFVAVATAAAYVAR